MAATAVIVSAESVMKSLAQHAHRVFKALEREREHALAHQLLNDGNALPVLPHALRFGVDPSVFGEGVCEALQPLGTGFFIVVFHTATGLQDLVRAHGRIPDEDQLVVLVVLAQDVESGELLGKAALVVLPHEVVDTVVEVVVLQVFELGFDGREHFFNAGDVLVHGAAHVHQQQHLDVVVPLGPR